MRDRAKKAVAFFAILITQSCSFLIQALCNAWVGLALGTMQQSTPHSLGKKEELY